MNALFPRRHSKHDRRDAEYYRKDSSRYHVVDFSCSHIHGIRVAADIAYLPAEHEGCPEENPEDLRQGKAIVAKVFPDLPKGQWKTNEADDRAKYVLKLCRM